MFQNALWNTFYGYFGFCTELMLCEVLFLHKVPVRDQKWKLLLWLLPPFLAAYLLYLLIPTGLISLLRYTIIFLLSLPGIHAAFDLHWRQVLFFGVAAYGVQNAVFHIAFSTAYFSVPQILPSPAQEVIRVLLSNLLSVLLCWFFGRNLENNRDYQLNHLQLIIASTIILGITIVLSYMPIYYDIYEPHASLLFSIYGTLCSLLGLTLQFGLLAQNRWKAEAALIRQLWQMDRRQYELAKDSIDLINVKSHDLKKQINLIRESAAADDARSQKALDQMEQAVNNYDRTARTGNEALDILLSQKLLYAANHQIQLTYMVNGAAFAFMDTIDLYSIFGNVLDNAMESAEKLADPDKRSIKLTAVQKEGFATIQCANYFDAAHPIRIDAAVNDGMPQTTKQDADYHGFGLRSIRMTLDKYNGNLTIQPQEDIFRISILIPRIYSEQQK